MEDCIFCKIVRGELPSTKVYEDDVLLAFNDINPNAKYHVLVIPKQHIEDFNSVTTENSHLIAKIGETIPKIAKQLGIDQTGYRTVINCGDDGGMMVHHLHFHVIGGQKLSLKLG